MPDSSAQTSSTLLDETKGILEHTEALLSEALAASGDEAKALQARIASGLEAARQNLGEAEQALLDKARDAAKATDSYVREHPWQAVGLGAALGLVVGMLIARR